MKSDVQMKSELRTLTVLGQEVRVSIRPAVPAPGAERPALPLLLCNGIGASLEALQPFVDQVDPAIEVIRFDVPGVGGSPDPVGPYNYPLLALGAVRMMRELGHERFDVLGISWGGGLAQQIAVQHRKSCRRLVLVATATGCLMVPAKWNVLNKMLTPRRYRDAEYGRAVAAELYGGQVRYRPDLTAALHDGRARAGSRRGYLFQLLAGAGWSSLPVLPLIRQRVLILAGNDDPLIPLINARIMARLLPHAELDVYADGHLGLMTLAEVLGPRVSRFLA
ncbi:poly(3-hydroxyalkanoate) depolymerase [Nocardioides sp. GXZ039]|uniref:poly(3-hydroxyalkanoate) depolymerase n=1 Tax=Nocardioides sp. GXZ039 TaxID=3136018 RepID=UPI0030F3EE2D